MTTLRRLTLLGIAALLLIALESVAAAVLARYSVLEHLLAPGNGSLFALLIVALFLLLRVFVLVLLPGLFVAFAVLQLIRRERK